MFVFLFFLKKGPSEIGSRGLSIFRDSGAIETTIKHCMNPKARFTPKMAFAPQTSRKERFKGGRFSLNAILQKHILIFSLIRYIRNV